MQENNFHIWASAGELILRTEPVRGTAHKKYRYNEKIFPRTKPVQGNISFRNNSVSSTQIMKLF